MGILNSVINAIKGLGSSVRGAFNNDPRYQQKFEWYPGSGGGGDVTKAYVDEQDGLLSDRIDALNTNKADKATTYTKTETDNLLDDKADKATTYTKTETDDLLDDKADKADTYTKSETDTLLSNKANKATTLAGYGITNAYTKTEINDLLDDKVDKINITAQGTEGLYPVKINAQGQISSYGTRQVPSDTYNSTANNQLLTRKGAYNLWIEITGGKNTNGYINITPSISYMCKNKTVCIRFLGNITLSGSTSQKTLCQVPEGYRPTGEVQGLLRVDYGGGTTYMPFMGSNGVLDVFTEETTLYNARGFMIYNIN